MNVFEILVLFFLIIFAGDRIGYLTNERDYVFGAFYLLYILAAIGYIASLVFF